MGTKDCFCLREVRLRSGDRWIGEGQNVWFVFSREGRGEFIDGAVRRRFFTGDALVASVTSDASIIPRGSSRLVFWCFGVALEDLFPLLAGSEVPLTHLLADTFKRGRIYAAGGEPALRCRGLLERVPAEDNFDGHLLLRRIVTELVSSEWKPGDGQPIGRSLVGKRATRLFERLSVAKITGSSPDELARECKCSRWDLNQVFQVQFGFSVEALKMELRLLKALALLQNPEAQISRVARESGFGHPGLFRVCFERRFGRSPTQPRQTAATDRRKKQGKPTRESQILTLN